MVMTYLLVGLLAAAVIGAVIFATRASRGVSSDEDLDTPPHRGPVSHSDPDERS